MSLPRDMSAEALASIQPEAPNLRAAVWRAIVSAGAAGKTCDELEQELRLTHQCCSARVHELMKRGLIVPNGTRKTRSGRNACAWITAPVEQAPAAPTTSKQQQHQSELFAPGVYQGQK